jgi:hypothetical protein
MPQGAAPPFDNRVPQMGMAPPNDMGHASGDSPPLFEQHRNQPMSSAAMEAQYFSALNSCGGAMMPPAHHTSQTFHAPATKGTGFNQECNIPPDSFTPPGMALHGVSPPESATKISRSNFWCARNIAVIFLVSTKAPDLVVLQGINGANMKRSRMNEQPMPAAIGFPQHIQAGPQAGPHQDALMELARENLLLKHQLHMATLEVS